MVSKLPGQTGLVNGVVHQLLSEVPSLPAGVVSSLTESGSEVARLLVSSDQVNALSGLGNAKFLLDIYHLSMNGENVPAVIEAYAGKTGHVQIADNPGRGAPGTGSLPLGDLLDRLGKAGYDGWVGLEYKPGDRPSAEAFDWLTAN